jgi:hypothetical protein
MDAMTYRRVLRRPITTMPGRVRYPSASRNGLIAPGKKQVMHTIHICIRDFRF